MERSNDPLTVLRKLFPAISLPAHAHDLRLDKDRYWAAEPLWPAQVTRQGVRWVCRCSFCGDYVLRAVSKVKMQKACNRCANDKAFLRAKRNGSWLFEETFLPCNWSDFAVGEVDSDDVSVIYAELGEMCGGAAATPAAEDPHPFEIADPPLKTQARKVYNKLCKTS